MPARWRRCRRCGRGGNGTLWGFGAPPVQPRSTDTSHSYGCHTPGGREGLYGQVLHRGLQEPRRAGALPETPRDTIVDVFAKGNGQKSALLGASDGARPGTRAYANLVGHNVY